MFALIRRMARSWGDVVADRRKYGECIQPCSEIMLPDVSHGSAARKKILRQVRIYPRIVCKFEQLECMPWSHGRFLNFWPLWEANFMATVGKWALNGCLAIAGCGLWDRTYRNKCKV
jgi:hypothetical protein